MGWRRESERLLAFEYELMPSQEQQRAMRRFVYDRALALQNANHEAGNKFIG
jgi:putative transposase